MSIMRRQIRETSEHLDDPYIEGVEYHDPTRCPVCGVVYNKKRWQFIDEKDIKLSNDNDYIAEAKCPACRKIEDHYVMGILELYGKFISLHKDEAMNLIKNEEAREVEKNPLGRIISIKDKEDKIYIETTNEALALRLGRAIFKTFKGSIEYKFSENQKLVRVLWRRD
jgi:hypothetical protein